MTASARAGSARRPVRLAGADPLVVLARLTDRDRYLCRALAEHRVLTTSQIAELAFGSATTAQHRLVCLHRLGILARFRRYAPAGSEPWHYTLGLVGAQLVATETGLTAPSPAALRSRTLALAGSSHLDHLVGVNGFFTTLAGYARRCGGSAALQTWWSERRTAAEYGEFVRPDGYGVWCEDDARVAFFLEHDTGSEPLPRVVAKLAGYTDLADAEAQRRWLVFWLSGARREAGLRRALGHPPIPVATASRALGGPAEAVWLPLGSLGPRRRLAELGDEH
ncbi:MAG TPA: replication-relaxation family protein [Mycobacteriales bacterium]|nr:replication-relaxation family protein [Mycobacteriales bacterium]